MTLPRLPLIHWSLLRINSQEHRLIHIEHHLVHDGWSFNVFLHELLGLYQAFVEAKPSPLSEPVLQFADYAYWQRLWLQREGAQRQLVYWQTKLARASPLLELPTDHPRPAVQSFNGTAIRTELPVQLCESLRALSRREGVTLFMTLMAAFLTLLHRYSAQDDISVGTGVANRSLRQFESLIGMLVDMVVIRVNLSNNPTFRGLLQQVRTITLEAYAHQDIPFEKIVEVLQPSRNLSYNPLFQVAFSFHDAPIPNLELPGLHVEVTEGLSNGSAKFDLNVIAIPRAEQQLKHRQQARTEGITFVWEYSTDLFDAATIGRMKGHFQTLLEGIVADPDQPIGRLPLLTEVERCQFLRDWNKTDAPYPRDRCIPELFEAQAAQKPAGIAVVFEARHLTYRELNTRANQLARYLQHLGVGAETRVAVYLPRSPNLIVALLGIWKAGGAYVPLDPAYPPEHIRHILKDAQAAVVLSDTMLGVQLPRQEGMVVYLDQDWVQIDMEQVVEPEGRVTPDQLAYVIYTSGSTGTPKGVQIEHGSLANLVNWHKQAFTISSQDHASLIAGLAFDASAWEIWPYLCVGAQLHIPREEIRKSLLDLWDWLVHQRITVCFLPTPLAEQAYKWDWPGDTCLRLLLTGGDLLHAYPPKELPFKVVNCYGPTESCVVVTATEPLAACDVSGDRPPPIGRPITNTQVYILDSRGELAPLGVPGELYLGGSGLARGYLNQPDLTADRFVPNPFDQQPGARLYRTGDIVCYRADGKLEFLGRRDDQIKLRGFRIELGEIETALRQHSAVLDAVAIVREDRPGDKRLVAYIVPETGTQLNASELRRFLQTKLPAYALPAALVSITALPLSPNGKIDRRALPAPDQQLLHEPSRNSNKRSFDLLEFQLTQVWEKILDVRPISVWDNFFELGGNSLLAVALVASIQEVTDYTIPITALFQFPTIERLAVHLRKCGAGHPWSPIVQLQAGNCARPPFFCIHPLGGSVFSYVQLPRHLGEDQPFFAIQARGKNIKEAPHRKIEEMAAYYIEHIRKIRPEGPYLIGGWSMGGIIAFEMARQYQQLSEEVALLAIIDTPAPSPKRKPEVPPIFDDIALLIPRLQRNEVPLDIDKLYKLPQEDQIRYLMEQAINAGFWPESISLAEVRRKGDLLRVNMEAARTYVPRPYAGHITVFRASAQRAELENDQTLGWDSYAAGSITVYTISGDHSSILTAPSSTHLGQQLRACLDRIFVNARGRENSG